MNRQALIHGLGAFAIGARSQQVAAAAELPVYRAGASPIASSAVIFFAQNLGYFAREGFNVAIQPAGNGDATAAAIVGGTLAFGGMNTLSLAIAHQNGIPLKIIASGAEYNSRAPATQMLVPRDSAAKSAKDLNGKTVAVNELKGAVHIAAQAWLDKAGGDSKSVRFVEMTFALMPTALTSHRVDAAMVAEPALTVAKQESRVFANCYDAISPRWLINAYVATESWIRENPEAARNVSRAISRTAAWSNRHHNDTIALESSISKVSPEIIAASTRTMFAETVDRNLIQPVIDIAVRYGALTSRFAASDLIAKI